jgi:hypothetical protein
MQQIGYREAIKYNQSFLIDYTGEFKLDTHHTRGKRNTLMHNFYPGTQLGKPVEWCLVYSYFYKFSIFYNALLLLGQKIPLSMSESEEIGRDRG